MPSPCPTAPECPIESSRCNLPVFEMDCETGFIDLRIVDCDVKTDCQIASQIIMALFIKGRDESSALPCRGGWWGNPKLGSRLWSLEDRAVSDIALTIEQYTEDALSPLVSAGIIEDVTVNASVDGDTATIDDILITSPDGQNNYSYLWEAGCA